jgi:hypothetical protein
MTQLSSVLVFLLGSTLSAWLRFDRGALLVSLVVLLVSLIGVVVTWLLEARRAPPLVWPRAVNELGSRERLTPEEERRFAAALREDHVKRQMEAWRKIQRHGPASLILPRAAFYYFWLCVFVLVLVPRRAVPGDVLPWVPRSVLVLTTIALAALVIAAPLGVRDWKRVLRSLEPDDGSGGRS